MSQPAARGWRRFVGVLVATLCVSVAYQRHAAGEAPGTATLTRWDLFAAAGTRNPNGIALHPNDGTVWMVAQNLGSLRLGQLDPDAAGPNYLEWTVPGVTGVAGPPVGLTLDSATGNVWFTTGGSPQLMVKLPGGVFRSFTLTALTSPNLHRFALSADGSTAFVPVQASGQTSIYRIPLGNGSSPLAGVERWRLTGSTDNPRHLTIDSAGRLWFTNTNANRLMRLDPAGGQYDNLRVWNLPVGTNPAGLYLVDPGSGGAVGVCVVSEGLPGTANGEVMCLSGPDSTNQLTRYAASSGSALKYPQQVAGNAAGELFITEQDGNSLAFISQDAAAGATATTLPPLPPLHPTPSSPLNNQRRFLPREITGTPLNVTVSDSAPVTAVQYTVAPDSIVVPKDDDASLPAGHVRFTLPASLGNPRPVGLTSVVNGAGTGTGSVYFSEYFGDSGSTTAGGAISLLDLGGESPDAFSVSPADPLVFDGTVGEAAPLDQMRSIDEANGRTIAWTATKSAAWLTLSTASPCDAPPPDGTCGTTPATLTISVDHSSLTPDGSPYTDTITIDDGPGGAEPVEIPVTLTVDQPTMTVAPLALTFNSVLGDPAPPAAQSFTIASPGATPVDWTATVNFSVPATLCDAVDPDTIECTGREGSQLSGEVSGTDTARLWVFITDVPGTAGTRMGTVDVTSTTAGNPLEQVSLTYHVAPLEDPILQFDVASLSLTAVQGEGPAVGHVTLTNSDPNNAIEWGVGERFTDVVLPAWLTVSAVGCADPYAWEGCRLDPGASVVLTVTANQNHASVTVGQNKAVLVVDDHEGWSAPATLGIDLTVLLPAPVVSLDDVNASNATAVPLSIRGTPGKGLTFTVTGVSGAPVTGTGTLDASGAFSTTVDLSGLGDGIVTAKSVLVDAASQIVSAEGIDLAIKDTGAPDPPTVNLPDVNAATASATLLTITGQAGTTVSYTVTDGATTPVVGTGTLSPSGSFSVTLNLVALHDGTLTATATLTDTEGNTSEPGSDTALKDTQPPGPPGVVLPNVNAANVTTVPLTISGQPGTQVAYSVFDGTTSVTGSGTLSPSGLFVATLDLTGLLDGTLTATATLTDATGNTSGQGTDTSSKDAHAPAPPDVDLPDVTTANVAAVLLTIAGEGGTTVSYSVTDGITSVTGSGTMGPGGVFTTMLDLTGLIDGALSAAATLSDAAGNTSAAGIDTAIKDVDAPDAPGVELPDVNAANVTAVPLTFTGEEGSTVHYAITNGTTSLTGTALMGADGSVTVLADLSTLDEGLLTATATLTDGFGNTSGPGSDTGLKDTIPPSAPTVTLADVNAANVTAVPLTIVGEPGASISYTISGDGTPVAGTGIIAPGGTFTTTVDVSGLADGALAASVTLSDEAGNASDAGEATSSKDATPPAAPVVTLGDVSAATVTAAPLTIAGEAGASFTYTIAGAAGTPITGAGAMPSGGIFSTTVDLSRFPDGTVIATATLMDVAGNESAPGTATAKKDVTSPLLTLPDNITVDATTPSGAVVEFTASATDNIDGAVPMTCTPSSGSTFPIGTTTVSCSASDAAGNLATSSFTVTVSAVDEGEDGRMAGGGYIDGPDARVHFSFDVREQEPSGERARLKVTVQPRDDDRDHKSHHDDGDQFVLTQVTSVDFSDNPEFAPKSKGPAPLVDTVTFAGIGEWNGRPGYTVTVRANDRGEPGVGRDTFGITILDPTGSPVASYPEVRLAGGNIQSHRLPGRVPPAAAPHVKTPKRQYSGR